MRIEHGKHVIRAGSKAIEKRDEQVAAQCGGAPRVNSVVVIYTQNG